MSRLILHPTDMSQWHALVHEAETTTQLILPENTESYLVFLLMRFVQMPALAESVLALDFFESMQAVGSRQLDLLREIGDKSLLLSGLFPGLAEKRHVKLTYFISMGQSAYHTVSELEADEVAELYLTLSKKFTVLQQVLHALSVPFSHETDLSRCKINYFCQRDLDDGDTLYLDRLLDDDKV